MYLQRKVALLGMMGLVALTMVGCNSGGETPTPPPAARQTPQEQAQGMLNNPNISAADKEKIKANMQNLPGGTGAPAPAGGTGK